MNDFFFHDVLTLLLLKNIISNNLFLCSFQVTEQKNKGNIMFTKVPLPFVW